MRTSLKRTPQAPPEAACQTCAGAHGKRRKARSPGQRWTNIEYRYDRLARGKLPVPGANPSACDVKQGALGDCYVLSTLGVVAHQRPQRIHELLRRNPNGTFSVTFRRPYAVSYDARGRKVTKYLSTTRANGVLATGSSPATVTIDDAIPLDANGQLLYARHADDQMGSTWVALMEKAYAREFGGAGGLASWTGVGAGGYPDNVFRALGYENAGSAPADSASFDRMRAEFASGAMFVVASNASPDHTKPDPPDIPPTSHAYMVMGFGTAKDGTPLIQLRNPWGDAVYGKYGAAFTLSKSDFLKYYAYLYGSVQP